MTYRRALAGGRWPLKTVLLKSGGLSGLLLVAFSVSFAMAISSLVARSFKSIRWIAYCPKRLLVCLRMALYLGACSSPFSRAMSDKCSRAAIAEWTSNTPGRWDRSGRRFWRANGIFGKFWLHRFYPSLDLVYKMRGSLGEYKNKDQQNGKGA